MIDSSSLKSFIKDIIDEYVDSELDFSTCISESIGNNISPENNGLHELMDSIGDVVSSDVETHRRSNIPCLPKFHLF